MKPLPFARTRALPAGTPAIIASLTCATTTHVDAVDNRWFTPGATSPDVLEWRADAVWAHATASHDLGPGEPARHVAAVAHAICARAQLPVILTARSTLEGGHIPAEVYPTTVAQLTATAGQFASETAQEPRDRTVDVAVDVEIERAGAPDLIAAATELHVPVIASYHDFAGPGSQLLARMEAMERAGAHVAKVAVTPTSMTHVIDVLDICQRAHAHLSIPVIAIAMGRLGAVTRLLGAEFGSAATFATGPHGASAPGQFTVEQIKSVLSVL